MSIHITCCFLRFTGQFSQAVGLLKTCRGNGARGCQCFT